MITMTTNCGNRIQQAMGNLDRLSDDYPRLNFQGHYVNIQLFSKDLIGWQFNEPPDKIDKVLLTLLTGFDCVIYNDRFDTNIKKCGCQSLKYGLFIFDEDIYYRDTVCGNCVPGSLAVPKHSILNGDSEFLISDAGFHCHSCFLESLQPFTQTAKHIIMSADMSNSLKIKDIVLNSTDLEIS
jgi:hypothetical protein